MPMPGGQCESNDLKVLGVDLDLDLMQNGTTADAFFEAIGKMHALEKYDQFALSICIFPLPYLVKQEFRFFFCHSLNPILITILVSAGSSISPILIFFLIFSLILGTPPPSPDSSSHSQAIIKSEFEANTLPAEAKVVRLGM